MRLPKDLTYEAFTEDHAQRIDIEGEPQDVRLYLDTLIDSLFPIDGATSLRQTYRSLLDDIQAGSAPESYIQIGGANMRIYYLPGRASIHPWASKPSPYFPLLKDWCDAAWEKTTRKLTPR